MKMTADQVVSRVSTLAAARGPKAVCEPCPPKAPARSADRPCCKSTTPIRKKHTMMCKMTTKTRRIFILKTAFLSQPGSPGREDFWCGRGDLNPYAFSGASTSSWCVCQFRHLRTVVNSPSIAKVGLLRNSYWIPQKRNPPSHRKLLRGLLLTANRGGLFSCIYAVSICSEHYLYDLV